MVTGALLIAAAATWIAAAGVGLAGTGGVVVRSCGLLSSAGGALALVGGILLALGGHGTASLAASGSVVGNLDLRAAPLAAAFIVLLGLVAFAIGWYAPRYHDAGAGTALYLFIYNATLVASLAVLVAGDVVTFLVAWESMTLGSGLLVLRHHRREGVMQGALLFLALGELGFIMIVAAFVILASQAHSMDFQTIAAAASRMPSGWRTAAFLLALLGFGFKAGIVPLHIWLPAAHPVAPADGSAFLSGMVVKLGVYGIVLFGFYLVAHGPPWWGQLTMILGAVSALLGILYALMERDLKRFLAYSTVENVGVIMTAVGAGMTFQSYGRSALGAFMLLVALYHAVNHGVYKSLLFLEAGVVEHGAGTLDLDRLGGLVHRMPATSVITLVGTLGIAALPPLNGFVSEWLMFEGLFQAFRLPSHFAGVLIVVAAAVLGLTAGIAVMAFARAFGIGFLGMPRSRGPAQASEGGLPILGPGILAAACVALGVGAPAVLLALARVARAVTGVNLHAILFQPNLTIVPTRTNFSAFSPTYLAVFLVAVAVVPIAIYLTGRPRGRTTTVPVWDGGIVDFRARMQYTATTYANPMRVTFDRLYRPDVHVDRASEDPAGRSGPVHYRVHVQPLFERYLYGPVVSAVRAVARFLQPIQSGDVNVYLLYILVTAVAAYFIASR